METLLPSEIARLVLGYLHDQKCSEAAKVFLDTCPHLQECRTVVSNGRRFSTKVNGMTLVDILEKFSAVNTMIQERLSRISDCEQLKQCSDLLDQLKYIVEESRSQRFVVNINVPTQANPQTPNNSPILSSSLRKRRYSNNDREKIKRHKICSLPQEPESAASQGVIPDTPEATPLETLPGHVQVPKDLEQASISEKKDAVFASEYQTSYNCNKNTVMEINTNIDTVNKINNKENDTVELGDSREVGVAVDIQPQCSTKDITSSEKCTTSTSTEELLSVSCAAVQTTPYDTPESESETNDEPIENLSLLTKELLNRTELQERIAENINKAILPTDVSLKDESLNDSGNKTLNEGNTSIMAELNHAIKSIVEATEADPVFEKFLDEMIGPHIETDTSPDEEQDININTKTTIEAFPGLHEKEADIVKNNVNSVEPLAPDEPRVGNDVEVTEVPLKQRLRSSSRQQNVQSEEGIDKQKEQEKEQSALEDQNAAAIMSIINANIISGKSECEPKANIEIRIPPCEINEIQKPTGNCAPSPVKEICLNSTEMISTTKKSHTVKRIRPTKVKRDSQVHTNEFLSEQDILTMPTFIVCSKEEINSILAPSSNNNQYASVYNGPTENIAGFHPIAPKPPLMEDAECVFVKTVQIPQKTLLPTHISSKANLMVEQTTLLTSKQRRNLSNSRVTNAQAQTTVAAVATVTTVPASTISVPVQMPLPVSVPMPMPVAMAMTMPMPMPMPLPVQKHVPITVASQPTITAESTLEPINMNKIVKTEAITLYGNENSAKTTINGGDVPIINVDENISLSGTGLSPYLKFSSSKINPNHSLSEIELPVVSEQTKSTIVPKTDTVKEAEPSSSKSDIITKRTPRTLLKSRSKNHRLSLSTPRRSSHVRALDFNTPTKGSSNRSVSENEADGFSPNSANHAKSLCKTSLFKSPPFVNNIVSGNQVKTPLKVCHRRVPIATRSPRPKLMGGWEKYNGVGVIIGDMSPQSNDELQLPVVDNEQPVVINEQPAVNTQQPVGDVVKLKPKLSKGNWDADLRRALQLSADEQSKKASSGNTENENATKAQKKDVKTGKKRFTKDKNTKKALSTSKTHVQNKKLPEKARTAAKVEARDTAKDLNTSTKSKSIKDEVKDTSCVSTHTKNSAHSISNNIPEISEPKEHNPSDTKEQKTVKKYVQLKTIKSNLKDKENNESVPDSGSNVSKQNTTNTSEFSKVPVDITTQMLGLPDMIELETPRKFHNSCGVPPTPRLLSPSSNLVTPFMKASDDSCKVRSFISTPEFPTTPCIAFTPKYTQESTQFNEKKDEFPSCSPYYKPSSEQGENVDVLNKSKNMENSSKPSLPDSTNSMCYATCTSTKLEITQFEVIKENLPKEEAVKELKISSTSKDSTSVSALQVDCTQIEIVQTMSGIPSAGTNNYSAVKDLKAKNQDDEDKMDVADDSDSDTSSDSDSSSSSSTSGSSTTNVSSYSEELATYNKSKKFSNKIYTDTSNDSGKKTLRVTRSIAHEAAKSAQMDIAKGKLKIPADEKTNEHKQVVTLETEHLAPPLESSPLKVFPITKTDEQLDIDIKQTPAKDETLLNEADISETPSGSKSGVENLTNLSSKISAMITSEENLETSKSSGSSVTNPNITNKLTQKPRVLSVQEVKPRLITVPITTAEIGNKSLCVDDKLVVQLEEKRQRMIAKFREVPKTSVARGRGNRRRTFRGRRTGIGGLRRTYHSGPTTSQYTHTQSNVEHLSNEVSVESNNNNATEKHVSLCGAQKPLKTNSNCEVQNNLRTAGNDDDHYKKSVSSRRTSSNAEPAQSNMKHENISPPEENVENIVRSNEMVQAQEPQEELISSANGSRNISEEYTAKVSHSQLKQNLSITKSIADLEGHKSLSSEHKSQTSEHKSKLSSISNGTLDEQMHRSDSTKSLFKSKVDQVKRDLFSDEENEQKGSNITKEQSSNEKTDSSKNTEVDHPKRLSHVLQCLELVPTSKTEQLNEDEENFYEEDVINTTSTNLVEYQFFYDETIPIKKRRRRFSNHDLEFQANIILSHESNKECIKLMTPTDFEEIFNISPKMKKRMSTRKPEKNQKLALKEVDSGELCASEYMEKTVQSKPLATSSPVERPNMHQVKKLLLKTKAPKESLKNVQTEGKKRSKTDKLGELEKDISTAKGRKRKLSESKESSQVEKKPNSTDPQLLLSNLDVDKFLTSVHGPE